MVNFLMDAAGLLAAGIVCNQKIRLGRLLLACAGATAGSIWLFLYLPEYFLYLLMVHIVVNPLMVVFSYRPRSWWDFLRPLLTVYLVFFVAGGVQQSMRLYGFDSAWQILFSGLTAIGMFLVWQIRRRITRHVCLVELEFAGERISLTAFCDSGNLLRDSKTGREVSILQKNVLPEKWFEAKSSCLESKRISDKDEKNPERVEGLCRNEYEKSGRRKDNGVVIPKTLHRIPIQTIGIQKGEMEVFTLDKMRIFRKGRVREVEKPIIGLYDGTLMEHPHVDLLLNGSYF